MGDSGGPLWKTERVENESVVEKRATLIGLVSRGLQCARRDSPGVVVRVKKHLPWIRHMLKTGHLLSQVWTKSLKKYILANWHC